MRIPAKAETIAAPENSSTAAAAPPVTPAAVGEEEGLPAPRRYVAIAAVLAAIGLAVPAGSHATLPPPPIRGALPVLASRSVSGVTRPHLAAVLFHLPSRAAHVRPGRPCA